MQEIEALKSLGPFLLVQAALAIVIIGGGVWAAMRGNWERKTYPPGQPTNGNMFFSHDVMNSLRDMAENGRKYNEVLSRIENRMYATGDAQLEAVLVLKSSEAVMKELVAEMRSVHQLLEVIFNYDRNMMPTRRK